MLRVADSPRWTVCPASAAPTSYDLPPDPPSETQLEARTMRWAADCLLYGDAGDAGELVGRSAPNGSTLTQELAEFVATYVHTVRGFRPDLALREKIEGSHDADVSVDAGPVVRVFRIAGGWKVVDPSGDPRLLLPAVSVMEQYHEAAEVWIYQPRPFHVDGVWRHRAYDRWEMNAWTIALHRSIAATQNPAAPALVNEECGRCPKRSRCVALTEAAYAYHERVEGRGTGRGMSAEELSAELDFLDLAAAAITARRSGVRAEADARIRDGEWVPTWHIKTNPGKRELAYPVSVVEFITGAPAADLVPRSPHALEKAGVPRSVVKALSRRRASSTELAKIKPSEIQKGFK